MALIGGASLTPTGINLNSPIKLLFIIDYYNNPYAGTEGQLLKLLSGLDRSRFEPELAVFRASEYLSKHAFPVPVSVLRVTRLVSPISWLRLFRFLVEKRRAGFRIAHVFFNDASIICPPILKLLGYRIIISRRDMGYWLNRHNLLPLRINQHYVDKVIVNSHAVKEVTVTMEGYKNENVVVIYNGYEASELTHVNNVDGTFNGTFLKMVLVANIRPLKRIHDAIHALSILRKTCPNSHLYIVGGGDSSELEALCNSLGLVEYVSFLGMRKDVQALLPSFDIGLLCSESEGFSNTLIEYLQAGLAVICSDVGGNREIIMHGVNGLLYTAGDVDALVENLLKIVNEPSLRARLGDAGRIMVQEDYCMQRMLSLHEQLYSTLGR